MTAANLNPGQRVRATVVFKDDAGDVVPVDGVPKWSKTDTDDSIVRMDVDADGMGITLHYVGNGTSTVQVDADADRSSGVRDLIGVLSVVCSQPEATVVEITVGTPEADTPTPTP